MDFGPLEGGRSRWIVFSDLDHTLLDGADYSFAAAAPGLGLLEERGVPLVFCTSKTRAEVEPLRRRLGNPHPFVVENGGAIYIPRDTFPFPFDHDRRMADYLVVELGAPYRELVRALARLKRRTGARLRGFSDMNAGEVASRSGLSLDQAARAKRREYDEPFLILEPAQAAAVIDAADVPVTEGGRFHHLATGDKGRAVSILMGLYRRARPDALSVGIGDAPNDLSLLHAVDVPILVGDGGCDWGAAVVGLRYAGGAGPAGWNAAVTDLMHGGPVDPPH